jgi:hypothetical protein
VSSVVIKPSLEEFSLSVITALGFNDHAAAERNYEFNLRAAHQAVSAGAIVSGIGAVLRAMPARYANGRPDLLFYPAEIPHELGLLKKPFLSVLNKLYRRNILYNRRYPKPPQEGIIEPQELYEGIDDLIRTRLVCKYMDGPRFVCEELSRHCTGSAIEHRYKELSTEAGYYAWHFYLQAPVELMLDRLVEQKAMWIEIQISTQLAEVITALTHELYEARRFGPIDPKGRDWRWDASSQRFRSAYLGHGLHLLEGIIQNLKDDILAQSDLSTANDGSIADVASRSDEDQGQSPTAAQAAHDLEGK